MSASPSRLRSVMRARCPRCRVAPLFEHFFIASGRVRWPHMFPYCPQCGLKYEREEGYFLGAMYISYGLALALIAGFAALVFAATRLGFYSSVLAGLVLFVPFAPLIAVVARVLWIHLDRAIDP